MFASSTETQMKELHKNKKGSCQIAPGIYAVSIQLMDFNVGGIGWLINSFTNKFLKQYTITVNVSVAT